jgi:ADP-ribose pyrophosphatase YjhB (NUDIX family)
LTAIIRVDILKDASGYRECLSGRDRSAVLDFSADSLWSIRAVASFGGTLPALGAGGWLRLETEPGEVVFVLRTSDGSFWLQTKAFYPPGVYRLPTGGLKERESPEEAYARELAEETGISPAPAPSRIAQIGYRNDGVEARFVSYLCGVDHVDGAPEPADSGERISGWRKVTPDGLVDAADVLRTLAPDWRSWGEFRAVAHDVLVEALKHSGG